MSSTCPRRATLHERMNCDGCSVECMPWPPALRSRLTQAIEAIQCRALDTAVLILLDIDRNLAAIDRADHEAPYGRDPREVQL